MYFNHDSDVIFSKKVSLLTKNWPKWSKIAIFVIFWRFFGDNIPNFSKFSKKDVIFSFLTQFYVLKDSIYNYFRKQVFGYLGSIASVTLDISDYNKWSTLDIWAERTHSFYTQTTSCIYGESEPEIITTLTRNVKWAFFTSRELAITI